MSDTYDARRILVEALRVALRASDYGRNVLVREADARAVKALVDVALAMKETGYGYLQV